MVSDLSFPCLSFVPSKRVTGKGLMQEEFFVREKAEKLF